MNNVAVIYWSGTGNTTAMAEAVAKGCSGKLFPSDQFDAAGANRVCDSVICMEAPDAEAQAACEKLGAALADA